jgi:hypothetical protein
MTFISQLCLFCMLLFKVTSRTTGVHTGQPAHTRSTLGGPSAHPNPGTTCSIHVA